MKDTARDINGREYLRNVEPFDCVFCNHNVDCPAWACTSSMCNITKECFANNMTGTWCPFDDVHNSPNTRKR